MTLHEKVCAPDVIAYLKTVYSNGPGDQLSVGICDLLYNHFLSVCENNGYIRYKDVVDVLQKYFVSWGNFSGDINYPISTESNIPAYMEFIECDHMWDRQTEYGNLRYDLLKFIITNLEKDAEEKPWAP